MLRLSLQAPARMHGDTSQAQAQATQSVSQSVSSVTLEGSTPELVMHVHDTTQQQHTCSRLRLRHCCKK